MKSGTVATKITLEVWRTAVIFQEATMVEHRMTAVAYLPVVLLSANGQFRRGKLQMHIHRVCFSGSGDWGQSFLFPVARSPSFRTYSLITLPSISFCWTKARPLLTGTNLASFVSFGRSSIM